MPDMCYYAAKYLTQNLYIKYNILQAECNVAVQQFE